MLDLFERQDRALAAAEDRRLGAIQAYYIDPWYEDDQEEQEEEEEDGEDCEE